LLGELIRRAARRAGFSLIVARRIRAYASAAQKAQKKAGRDRHHHGRALHRRSMGQGG
jgi:hypothetical protein